MNASATPSNQAREVRDFITSLLNSDLNELHDLLINYGEDIEAKASDLVASLDPPSNETKEA